MFSHATLNLIGLCCIFVLGGCSIYEMNPTKYSYEFFEDKTILEKEYQFSKGVSYRYPEIVNGIMNVFMYTYEGAENPHFTDDEYVERLFFQVDPQLDTFRFKDDELEHAKCYFEISYFGPNAGRYNVQVGTIIGERICPDKYLLNINISISKSAYTSWRGISKKVKFQKLFRKSQ